MSAQKTAPNELLRKDVEHEHEYYVPRKLKPANAEPLADREEGFTLSMQVAPEALGSLLVMLNDMRGVNSVMLHGMWIGVESTDEVL